MESTLYYPNPDIKIELHADDYGETVNTSKEIIDLMKDGHLDGISIIANMHDFESTSRMFIDAVPDLPFLPYISIHLNLVEGRSLKTTDLLPWTWAKLFMISFHLPVRDHNGRLMRYREVFDRLTEEIRNQITKGSDVFTELIASAGTFAKPVKGSDRLRIDSHQHAHLIPIVWKALTRVIREDNLQVEYIRTAHEPLWPFVRHLGFGAHGITFIGLVKNRILAVNAPKVERYLKEHGIKPAYMWGLIMSGNMDKERIHKVMPHMLRKCDKKGYDLEMNIHPGRMLPDEYNEEVPRGSADTFYLSDNREVEADTARYLNPLQSS